jgi:hypothetical protein
MILNFEELTADFNQKLVTQLRSHGSGSEYLETWVPDENPVMSILNMVEAALSAGLESMTIRFAATTATEAQCADLLGEVNRIADAELFAAESGYDLVVHGTKV